jgi:hypothetical protein
MNLSSLWSALVILGFGYALVVSAQFTEPTGFPSTMNATEPLVQGSTRQQKTGDLIADYLTARNKWCLGSNCITSLWSSLAPTSCHLEVATINVNYDVNLATQTCDRVLALSAKNQGWVSMGGDNCSSMSSGNCAGGRTCTFGKIACTGGVTMLNSLSSYRPVSGVVTHPATAASISAASGGTLSLPYDLTRKPQCNDGLNNDGATGIDMADPQCRHLGDDSESVL